MIVRNAPRRRCAALLLALACAPAARASEGESARALALLERAAVALASRDYAGVYVHTAAGQSESFRVARRVDPGADRERVEALEGARREIVRTGSEVHVFLPASRTVRIERRVATAGFPQVLDRAPHQLVGPYRLVPAGSGRVASRDADIVRLHAGDEVRHSREVWLDRESGLPLKVRVLDRSGVTLEQIAFSEVRIGRRVSADRVGPGPQAGYAGWDVQTVTADLPPGAVAPEAAPLGAGFRLIGGVLRRAAGDVPAAVHWTYSDGLAVVSLFVEEGPGISSTGSTRSIQRGGLWLLETVSPGRRLTAIGEVPRGTLERGLAAADRMRR